MSLDLDNEVHRKALLSACGHASDHAMQANPSYCETMAQLADAPVKWAFEALADPAKAAELIRRLVERAGASSLFDERELAVSGLKVLGYVFIAWDEWHVWVNECGIPAFIARLLAIVPGAGGDAVLAALRGEG